MRAALAALGLALVLASAPAAAMRPADFAFGLALQTPERAPVYRLPLPAAVYRGAVHPNLGDLRVFAAGGQPVPHALRPAPVGKDAASPGRVLPFTAAAGGPGDGRRYVIDLGEPRVVGGLRVAWAEAAGTHVGALRVETSAGLRDWTTLVPETALGQLDFGGEVHRHDEVEIGARAGRYLRLTWPRALAGLRLRAVRLLASAAAPGPQRSLAVPATVREGEGGEVIVLRYAIPPAVPAAAFSLRLPEVNSALAAAVAVRRHAGAPWRPCFEGVFYRLRAGDAEIRNPGRRCRDGGDGRQWRVRIDAAQWAAAGGRAPRLELRWRPHELVFLARGEGPWRLAWGSAGAPPARQPLARLLQEVDEEVGVMMATARPGDRLELGGPERLSARRPLPWQRIALWGVLGLGVIALLAMAVGLYRDLQ